MLLGCKHRSSMLLQALTRSPAHTFLTSTQGQKVHGGSSGGGCAPRRGAGPEQLTLVPRRRCEMEMERMASSEARPPALRTTWHSPVNVSQQQAGERRREGIPQIKHNRPQIKNTISSQHNVKRVCRKQGWKLELVAAPPFAPHTGNFTTR